jgi:hypothetical protein
VTDGEDGGGRLVIRLNYGEPIVSPDGWPRLPTPEPGEPVAAFVDRAIVGDPFLQFVTSRTSGGPVPPLAVVRPAERTFAWWEEEWPNRELSLWDDPPPRNYHRDRVYWRLVVEWFDRLRDSDPVMRGHRTDLPAYPSEEVEPGLFRNHYMELRPHAPGGGWFRPEEWRGDRPPPGLLRRYRELTLWPAQAAEAKRAKTPRQLTADALVSLQGEGVDIRSPASVAALHKLAEAKSGVKVSKATLERALADARLSPVPQAPS